MQNWGKLGRMINIEQLKSKFVAYKTECQLTLNSLEIKEKDYNSIKEYN